VNWVTGLGQAAGSQVSQTFFPGTSGYETVQGYLDNGVGQIVVAGTTSWKYSAAAGSPGIQSKDDLLSTMGDGPVELSFQKPLYGVGAFVQADGGGQFTARIQAFAGLSTVLDMAVNSDAAGHAIFLGASDTLQEITKVIYSITSAPKGYSTGDFVVDTLYLENQVMTIGQLPVSGAPEPGMAPLLAVALAGLCFMWRKQAARV